MLFMQLIHRIINVHTRTSLCINKIMEMEDSYPYRLEKYLYTYIKEA